MSPRHLQIAARTLSVSVAIGVIGGLADPSQARADRVVLIRPTTPDEGFEIESRLDDLEDVLAQAIQANGHAALTEQGNVDPNAPPPTTANQLKAVADLQNALFVVTAELHSRTASTYRVRVRVGYAPESRLEEIDVLVPDNAELPRLIDVLGSMLRPEGLGDDAVRLAQEPEIPSENQEPPTEPETTSETEDDVAAREAAAAEEARRLQDEANAEEAWQGRERYAQPGSWMVSAGVDIRPLVAFPSDRSGGVLGSLSLRGGRSFSGLDGFEVRAVLDLTIGAQSGFAIGPGAVYMWSPFSGVPIHLGASVELGLAQALTGNRVPQFFARIAPIGAWRLIDQFFLEATLLEVQVLSANGGALTLGASVRAALQILAGSGR